MIKRHLDDGRGSKMFQFYEPKLQFTRLKLVLASLFRRTGEGMLFSLKMYCIGIHDHKKKCLNIFGKKLRSDGQLLIQCGGYGHFTKNLRPLKQITGVIIQRVFQKLPGTLVFRRLKKRPIYQQRQDLRISTSLYLISVLSLQNTSDILHL